MKNNLRYALIVFGVLFGLAAFTAQPARAATTVTGRLTEPDGITGVPNAWLNIHDNSWSIYQIAYTTSDGSFSFSDLPACSCTLEAFAGHATYANPDPISVTVAAGQALDLGVYRLVTTNVIGALLGPDNTTPISGISVSLQNADYTVYRYDTTDANGQFGLRLPSAGSYALRVMADYVNGATVWYAPPDQTVTVTDPSQTLNVGNVLMKSPNVTGTLTEPDGSTPVPYASVNIRSSDYSVSKYTTTATDGTFGLYVPAGQYTLDVSSSSTTYSNPDPLTLTVTSGQTRALGSIRLLSPNIFFKVVKADGATPVSGASISLHNSNWSISRYQSTQADGTASLTLSTAGTYTVDVWASDPLESNPDPFTFTFSGSNVYFDGTNGSSALRLQAPSVRGIVLKPDSSPASNASVYLFNATNTVSKWASTQVDGSFAVPAVPTGTYTLQITPSWDSNGLIGPDDSTLNLTQGSTNTTYLATPITLGQALKTISGTIRKPNGTPVTDANVNAWKSQGSGWAQTTTNAAGQYSLIVGRGAWSVSVNPNWSGSGSGSTTDWGYFKSPTVVTFSQSNSVAESQTADFEVQAYTATITGALRNPDGTIPASAWVSFWSQGGLGNGVSVDSQGIFSVRVAPGTYNVDIYSSNELYASPEVAPVTVTDGETKDFGTLKFVTKNEFITGRVLDSNGVALANQSVSAWKIRGSGWASAQTDVNGNYSLSVSPGAWYVDAYPGWYGYGEGENRVRYAKTQDPQPVSLNANETLSNVNFTFAIADATISGTVQNEAGNVIEDLAGWLEVQNANATPGSATAYMGGFGGEVRQGRFSVKVPGGAYNLGVWLPYQAGYTASSQTAVTVASGGTVSDAVVTMVANDVTVTGTLRDANGRALTTVSGSVYAMNGAAGHQWAPITNGTYTLQLSRGDWRISYWIDPMSGYLSQPLGDGSKLTLTAGETRTLDFTLQKLDSTISGRVLDPDGNPLPNAWISIDTEFGSQRSSSQIADVYGGAFNRGNLTDGDGRFSIAVPQGDYFVSASLPTSFGYINPPVQTATVTPAEPAALTFAFRRSDSTISGSVTLSHTTSLSLFRAQNHQRSPAYVSAWSDGGFAEQYTNTGDYTLNVTKGDTWHVRAVYETTATFYASVEHLVTVGDSGAATLDLSLEPSLFTLPPPVSATFASNVTKVIQLEDGATITMPANALSATEVDVTVTATPKAQLPNQASGQLLTFGYDLSAVYASGANAGQAITAFAQDVTISLPYTEAQLEAADVTADDLKPMYWDSTKGAWIIVDNVIIDTSNKRVSFTVQHFTSFGLLQTGSAEALTLTLSAPTDGTILRRNSVTVSGTVSDATASVSLTLNSGAAQTLTVGSAGTFSTALTSLRHGSNTITVRATKGTETTSANRTVTLSAVRAGDIIVTVPKFGSPHVRVFNQSGRRLASFFAYSQSLRAKLNVMTADLDGDGADEIITYLSEGYAPHVRVFNQQGGRLADAFIYHAGFRGGVQLTTGDINGDGLADLIFAPKQGGSANLRAYTYNPDDHSLDLLGWTMAYQSTLQLKLKISAADVNLDGADEIIVAPAEAGGPNVRAYTYDSTDGSLDLLGWFMAYAENYRGGVELLTANVSGDSTPEIVVAPTVGGTNVRAYSYSTSTNSFDLVGWFMAYADSYRGGVKLAAADIDNDGWSEIITAPQTGGPNVRVYGYVEADHEFDLVDWFMAYDNSFRGGVQIATGDVNADGQTDIITAPKQDGSANVRVYSYTASTSSVDLLDWLMAYQTGYRQPIELTAADFDADGDAEIMVTPLGAGGPNVRILDFADNELSLSSWFMAYADSFRGGVRAAIGQQ